MAGYSMTAIEDALLAALQAQMGAQVQTLETYQGDWRADLERRTWRLPAALITLVCQQGEQVAWGSYDLTLDVAVLVLVRQLRGEEEGRRSEGGVYQLLESVRRALWHQDLGLDLQPLALLKEEALLSTPELIVYGAYYRTGTWQDF